MGCQLSTPKNAITVFNPFSRPNFNKRRYVSRANSLVLQFEPTKSSVIEAAAVNEDETDSKGDEAMKSRAGNSVTQRSIEIFIDAQE